MKRDPFRRLLLAALVALSSAASGGEIAGKVMISGEAAVNVVVSIEGLKVEDPLDRPVLVIDHRDLDFVPHVLVVRAGATVEFKNSDGMPCRIYSISPGGTFLLRRQDGGPMRVTFDRAGVIEIRCADHARIYAYLVVKENPYFALTEKRGRYRIAGVPSGRYTLAAWYEGAVLKTQTVEVGLKKLRVDLRASRPQPRREVPAPTGGDSAGHRISEFLETTK